MSQSNFASHAFAAIVGASVGYLAYSWINKIEKPKYTIADQPKRFANAKLENNKRVLDIDAVYQPKYVQGKTVLVTGGNRGLGLAIAKEFAAQGARVIITTRKPETIANLEVVSGIDVSDDDVAKKLVSALKGTKIDILVNNAGYFYGPSESFSSLNFQEEKAMIDICAIGPLRITAALFNAGLLRQGSKVAMITSQGGSIEWRRIQNPKGGDYGHHMSKAAANMMGILVSQELKEFNIPVSVLHPGFNMTDMTKKYESIWEIEGAVDSSVGAKRVVHEIGLMNMSNTGDFINCEDGLMIPW